MPRRTIASGSCFPSVREVWKPFRFDTNHRHCGERPSCRCLPVPQSSAEPLFALLVNPLAPETPGDLDMVDSKLSIEISKSSMSAPRGPLPARICASFVRILCVTSKRQGSRSSPQKLRRRADKRSGHALAVRTTERQSLFTRPKHLDRNANTLFRHGDLCLRIRHDSIAPQLSTCYRQFQLPSLT